MQREKSTLKHHFRLGFVTQRVVVVIEKSHFILVVNLLSLLTVLVPLCVLPSSWILHEIPLLELLKIYGENCVEKKPKRKRQKRRNPSMLLANILDDFSMLQYFLFRRSSTLDSCNLYVYEIQNASEQKEEEKNLVFFCCEFAFPPFFLSLHLLTSHIATLARVSHLEDYSRRKSEKDEVQTRIKCSLNIEGKYSGVEKSGKV